MWTLPLTAPNGRKNVPEGDCTIMVLYHTIVNLLSKRVACTNTHHETRKKIKIKREFILWLFFQNIFFCMA
jgi:hypothetical protein